MLKELLDEFVRKFELPPYKKEGNYLYSLELDPNTTLFFHELDPGFHIAAKIIPFSEEKREDLLTYLMNANFLGQGTGGSAICLEPDEKFLTLSTTFTYDMNFKTFIETIEDFANYLDYWREEIPKYQKKQQQSLFT